ncbi:MAG: hypothetical protein ABJ360_09720 [Roseobacter sp.]
MSPGIAADGFVFLTGVTGASADGTMPQGDVAQFEPVSKRLLQYSPKQT